MSIRHAANRFRKTPITGWDGTQWLPNITYGSFIANDRFISDREFGNKLRNLLIDPAFPLPANISLVRIGDASHVYMVGRSSEDVAAVSYSTLVTLRRAYYTGTIETFGSTITASGLKTTAARHVIGTYPCDRENITFAGSKEFPTVKFGDELVVLPKDAIVSTTNEIRIDNKCYEVEEVYTFSGLIYCRCVVKANPQAAV